MRRDTRSNSNASSINSRAVESLILAAIAIAVRSLSGRCLIISGRQRLISGNLDFLYVGIGFVPIAKPFNSVELVAVIIDPDPSIERSEKQMEECRGQSRMQLIQQRFFGFCNSLQ